MYHLYRTLTRIAAPAVPTLLKRRLARGKEDGARLPERMGIASAPRPTGKLLWIHAASVGEANSVLQLIERLLAAHPGLHVLLTTVTVTSAKLMGGRLPQRAFHQFAPVDTLEAVERFLSHWRPDVALWVDSEFWPNLIMETASRGAVMGVINARMSEQSFRSWRFAKGFIREMLSCFRLCFAQSEEDKTRLLQLGLPTVTGVCNLKYDAPALPCNEQELAQLIALVGERPVWVAASTHKGEEQIIAKLHKELEAEFAGLLSIIVPRHANRGAEIASELHGMKVARRSQAEAITPETDIYLADTMGELGLFYRLARIAFIGGTLVPHGGQNPLEAARVGCAIVVGPHTHNFTAVIEGLRADGAILTAQTPQALREHLHNLLHDPQKRHNLGEAATHHAQTHDGAVETVMNALQSYLK